MLKIYEHEKKRVMRINWNDHVSTEQLEEFKEAGGIGIVSSSRENNLDKKELERLGLDYLTPEPFASDSVAELCALFVLMASRFYFVKNPGIGHTVCFHRGTELMGKNALVVGSDGAIGQAVVRILKGMGLTVFDWDIQDYTSTEKDLFRWLSEANFVVACIPAKGNKRFFRLKHFEAMKNAPVFINLSRGELLSPGFIHRALNKKQISYYMVDDAPEAALCKTPGVFCTSHVGSNTVEARKRQEKIVEQNVSILFKKNS